MKPGIANRTQKYLGNRSQSNVNLISELLRFVKLWLKISNKSFEARATSKGGTMFPWSLENCIFFFLVPHNKFHVPIDFVVKVSFSSRDTLASSNSFQKYILFPGDNVFKFPSSPKDLDDPYFGRTHVFLCVFLRPHNASFSVSAHNIFVQVNLFTEVRLHSCT